MNLGLELNTIPAAKVDGRVGPRDPSEWKTRSATEGGESLSLTKRLTHRHHNLARHLAAGVKPGDAAIMCGYSPSRVSILQTDPAFKELIQFYKNQQDREFGGLHEKLVTLAADVTDELQRRVEEEPDDIPIGQLVNIMEKTADRTGHGVATTANNLHVHAEAGGAVNRLAELLDGIAANNKTKTIAHSPSAEGAFVVDTPFENDKELVTVTRAAEGERSEPVTDLEPNIPPLVTVTGSSETKSPVTGSHEEDGEAVVPHAE